MRSAIAPLHSTFHVKTCIWQQLKPIMPVINVIKMSPCCNLLLLIRLLRASKWHFGKGTQSEKCLSWLHQHKSTFSAENTTTMWIVSQSMRAFSLDRLNFFLISDKSAENWKPIFSFGIFLLEVIYSGVHNRGLEFQNCMPVSVFAIGTSFLHLILHKNRQI